MVKKRGQLTAFVIIGLFILLMVLVLSLIRRESIEEAELINPELIPVQQYVETCSKELAKEALQIVGFNGGYIYFPVWVDAAPQRVLQASPNKDLRNPYWWFDGVAAIPAISQIEQDISRYVREGMPGCINNFSAFKNKYLVDEMGEMQIATILGQEKGIKEDVAIRTIFPIRIKDKLNKTLAELQSYVITIPVRFNAVYNLAKEVMEREKKDFFIEERTIDLINLDQRIPTTGFEVNCNRLRWDKRDVEKRIKSLLSINLNHIKVKNTKFDPGALLPYVPDPVPDFRGKFTEAEVKAMAATPQDFKELQYLLRPINDTFKDSYFGAHYVWDLTDNSYKNMKVSFFYDPGWDFIMDVSPSRGQFLEANAMRGQQFFSYFCMNLWHFTYSMVFPVKVTIADERTEKNDPYTFSFAFMAKITKNYPDKTSVELPILTRRETLTSEEYCADILGIDHTIRLIAQNAVTREPVNRVNLSFTCGRYTCDIGQTKPNYEGSNQGMPMLDVKLPQCVNGIIRGEKNGYEEGQTFIQTETEATYEIPLQPIKHLNISIVKHRLSPTKEVLPGKPMEEKEEALITVRYPPKQFESFAIYTKQDKPVLKLLAGETIPYQAEAYLKLNETIRGGFLGNFTAEQGAVTAGDRITFHVIEKDFKDDDEAYLFFEELKAIAKKLPQPKIT
ncbi:hypothetical protein HYV84_06635 [Candidatus Woesearchaeota archaeon]|nr:hypothetical protein [Candidatus Woesearchaeota archaeon]